MSSIDKSELRRLAEPYKSFPAAVAAVVRAMFDAGAETTRVEIGQDGRNRRYCSIVRFGSAQSVQFRTTDAAIATKEFVDDLMMRWGLAFVHHSGRLVLSPHRYEMNGLGEGEGVNPRQDRSAQRLMRELPKLLAPFEAAHTTLVDEDGNEHRLLKEPPSTLRVGAWEIDLPEKMIGWGDGLVVKFGHVRVPVSELLARVTVDPRTEFPQLQILTHPWLQGVMEMRVMYNSRPVELSPTRLLAELDERVARAYGPCANLARMLLYAHVPGLAMSRLGKAVESAMSDFQGEDGFFHEGRRYRIRCADLQEIAGGFGQVLWEGSGSTETAPPLLLDPSHEVFLTVGPDDDELMQIVWWQLAAWIAEDLHASRGGKYDPVGNMTRIYLSLRRLNPERRDV
ncbi:hypothetical protein HY630_03255 [Candidatus Uhrbacteria bacterium]|nr:hypothetical protein [Candidatus Uhrbacteria bacterium]